MHSETCALKVCGQVWDPINTNLSGLLWAYGSTPHESTSEKSFSIMFGVDYGYTSEIALMPTSLLEPTELTDYCEELVLSLSMVRELVASNIWKA